MSSPKQTKPKTPTFAVEWWPIGRVTPYPNNARVIPASAVEKVASSIRSFGWRQPIVVDTAGVIVVGHVRLLAAQSMALAEVPVHVARDLTPSQVKAYRLMDNRSHDEATWDLGLIGPELQSWRSGAPEELGGPTSQPGARRRDTGHPGAKRWRPVRDFGGFANARPGFQGPDSRGGGRGSNGGAVCLVSCRFSGCHPAFKSLILRDWA